MSVAGSSFSPGAALHQANLGSCAACATRQTEGNACDLASPCHLPAVQVRRLADDGLREVTLLGQNVNSYNDESGLAPDAQRRGAPASDDAYGVYAEVWCRMKAL